MEIERKFLLPALPEIKCEGRKKIEQRYISVEPEVRIRKTDTDCYITFKGKGDLAREEVEIVIDQKEYASLVPFAVSNAITKTRYLFRLGEYTAEADVYGGELEGLMAVEVEFKSTEEADAFIPPAWFGTEITYDKRFKNRVIAFMSKEEARVFVASLRNGYEK